MLTKRIIAILMVAAFALGWFAAPVVFAAEGAEPVPLYMPAVLTAPVADQTCDNCHIITETERILTLAPVMPWVSVPNLQPVPVAWAPD